MTAGELIAQVDTLRPNHYTVEEKLGWLRRIDGQILRELEETHVQNGESAAFPEDYTEETELRVGFPYDSELYTAYLFCQIDLHNGEIGKYNQSMTLLSAAWRQLADSVNRGRLPESGSGWKL